jgi:hypothetical protein
LTTAAAQRAAWLTLLATRGELVSYESPDATLTALKVVFTRPGEDQVELDENYTLESKAWDVLIDPATLVADGEPFEPSLGHKITKADGSVYRVQSGDGTRTPWRWSDALKTWRRVHAVAD